MPGENLSAIVADRLLRPWPMLIIIGAGFLVWLIKTYFTSGMVYALTELTLIKLDAIIAALRGAC